MYNAQVHVMYTVEIQDSKLTFTVLLFKGVILIRCSSHNREFEDFL